LGPGELKIEKPNGEVELVPIKSGVVEMNNNKLIVLAEQ
jgi:F0F1-type ATP synthase epsilon subunit